MLKKIYILPYTHLTKIVWHDHFGKKIRIVNFESLSARYPRNDMFISIMDDVVKKLMKFPVMYEEAKLNMNIVR